MQHFVNHSEKNVSRDMEVRREQFFKAWHGSYVYHPLALGGNYKGQPRGPKKKDAAALKGCKQRTSS